MEITARDIAYSHFVHVKYVWTALGFFWFGVFCLSLVLFFCLFPVMFFCVVRADVLGKPYSSLMMLSSCYFVSPLVRSLTQFYPSFTQQLNHRMRLTILVM